MTGRLPTWLLALTLAGCAAEAPNPPTTPETTEPTVTHSESPEPRTTPRATPEATDTESAIIREILAISAVVKRYLAAGRPITMLGVTTIHIEPDPPTEPFATAKIRVEGEPPKRLGLRKVGDTWCVSM